MIIVRIRGGLGNQLFGYAFASFLKTLSEDVFVDVSEYSCFQCHDGLEVSKIFSVDFPNASTGDIMRCSNYIPIPFSGKLGIALFELELRRGRIAKKICKKETHIHEDDINKWGSDEIIRFVKENLDKDLYFDGYWGGSYPDYVKYLDDTWLEFRDDYTSKYVEYTNGMDFEKACSVHVRKGDFTGTSLDTCDSDYFSRAMEYIDSKRDGTVFYVFSDELDKACDIIGRGPNIVYVDTSKEKTAGLAIWLMSLCRDNIIPNSSFSYWASRLNRHPDKIVIMPQIFEQFKFEKDVLL